MGGSALADGEQGAGGAARTREPPRICAPRALGAPGRHRDEQACVALESGDSLRAVWGPSELPPDGTECPVFSGQARGCLCKGAGTSHPRAESHALLRLHHQDGGRTLRKPTGVPGEKPGLPCPPGPVRAASGKRLSHGVGEAGSGPWGRGTAPWAGGPAPAPQDPPPSFLSQEGAEVGGGAQRLRPQTARRARTSAGRTPRGPGAQELF